MLLPFQASIIPLAPVPPCRVSFSMSDLTARETERANHPSLGNANYYRWNSVFFPTSSNCPNLYTFSIPLCHDQRRQRKQLYDRVFLAVGGKPPSSPMSALGLFVPTYGKSETDGRDSAAKQTKASRVLPSKPTAPQPKTRQSSLSSLVFNGNIEYIQVHALPSLHPVLPLQCRENPRPLPLKFSGFEEIDSCPRTNLRICKFKFERISHIITSYRICLLQLIPSKHAKRSCQIFPHGSVSYSLHLANMRSGAVKCLLVYIATSGKCADELRVCTRRNPPCHPTATCAKELRPLTDHTRYPCVHSSCSSYCTDHPRDYFRQPFGSSCDLYRSLIGVLGRRAIIFLTAHPRQTCTSIYVQNYNTGIQQQYHTPGKRVHSSCSSNSSSCRGPWLRNRAPVVHVIP